MDDETEAAMRLTAEDLLAKFAGGCPAELARDGVMFVNCTFEPSDSGFRVIVGRTDDV